MKVCDIVRFNGERYFNGAVQTEWFYDQSRIDAVAKSYVFHGPTYFGVSSKDISKTAHTLIDTASFTKIIADKLYPKSSKVGNSFVMTIAGYGTGKSHLAVCLGALFSGNKLLSEAITDHIILADKKIGEHIRSVNNKRNLIIALNGMNNFNLDAEILKCARLSLSMNGISDDVLRSITKSYDIARLFLEKNFTHHIDSFSRSASSHGIKLNNSSLKEYLISHVEDDKSALEVINEVYKEVNGDTIHWSRGLSAGDILRVLQAELCGPEKPFNKVLILFDEFGRYIEYSAANPTIAGEASLQQIFEAVQAAYGRIIFAGFIQNDLTAYLSRIEKTANIIRYVGRFENSEKLYLSSNFETILANLLEKDEEAGFSRVTENAVVKYDHFHKRIFEALARWDKSAQKKAVWADFSMYKNVVLKGCYPLHPVTTWLLSSTSSWMQQRSTFAFVSEMFDGIKNQIIEGAWLPYVYPVDIIDSGIYNEMLNSEEKGLVQSQYCMLYRDIMVKIGDKLTEKEKRVLQAILILNIGKFALRDKGDASLAIRYCTNLSEDEIAPTLNNLEEMHGVIAFDESAKTYDLIAEASGYNEFKRIYVKYRIGTNATIEDIDSDLLQEGALSGALETSFAQEHNISSKEWSFERKIVDASKIDGSYVDALKKAIDNNISGESPRGVLLYAYCNKDRDSIIPCISKLYRETQLADYPVVILFLDDSECEVTDALAVKKTIAKFSGADKERFRKHIDTQERAINKKIIRKIIQLIGQKNQITESGISSYECRLSMLCSEKLRCLYSRAPSFAFDGFQNKTTTQAKKALTNICVKLFDKTLMNIQSYQAMTQDEKNRVRSCLAVGAKYSWQVFDNKCNLLEPKDPIILSIFNEVGDVLAKGEPVFIMPLMTKYIKAPYGMNINSISLFTFYYISFQGNSLYCFYGEDKLTPAVVSNSIFKGGKLQLAEFRKLRLQINVNANVDQVAAFCKKTQACTNIEEFSRLRNGLNALVVQEGLSEANQTLVAQAKMRLDEGSRILNSIQEKNVKAKELIATAKKGLNIPKFVKVFDYLADFSKPLSEEYDFTCGEVTQQAVSSIKSEAETVLIQKFAMTINAVNCDITQLSQYKATYEWASDLFESKGYKEYAETIRKRLDALQEELIAKQKYEKMLAELERDLAMASNLSLYTYKELSETQVKMNNWSEFIQKAKELPKSISEPLLANVISIRSKAENEKRKLIDNASSCIKKCNGAESLEKLVSATRTLEEIQKNGYEPELDKTLIDCISTAKERIRRIESLPDNMDELVATAANLSKMDGPAVSAEVKRKLSLFRQQENEWGKKNIVQVEIDLSSLTASDCASWMEKTSILPHYLGNETRNAYQKLKVKVEQHLHKCKIEGVVSMFNSLSDTEKETCLNILLKTRKIGVKK